VPDGKGIAGGILLGAEVVMIPIAIGGIEEAWPYPVFGALGAVGGGIGGYFVETTGSAEASIYMLAGGMALIIPTVVAVLNVTVYGTDESGDEEGEDEVESPAAASPDGAAPAELPASSPAAARLPRNRRSVHLSLVGVDDRGVAMGIPSVTLAPTYSPFEVAAYGAEQGTDVRFSLVGGTF
jgi:hypothetical protein